MAYLSQNLRQDLIAKELDFTHPHFKESEYENLKFKPFNPNKKSIERLFRGYTVEEFLENSFDSTPEIDKDLQAKAHAYEFHRSEISADELNDCKQAFDAMNQLYADYEERRILSSVWCEVYGEGIWGLSQFKVDKIAKDTLHKLKRSPVSYNGRMFYAETSDTVLIYYYGRDYLMVDYWWTFKKRAKKRR